MNPEDYGLIKMSAHYSAQVAREGYNAYSENLRYDYLEGKAIVNFAESLGARYIQGPHPQYGSPDAPKA